MRSARTPTPSSRAGHCRSHAFESSMPDAQQSAPGPSFETIHRHAEQLHVRERIEFAHPVRQKAGAVDDRGTEGFQSRRTYCVVAVLCDDVGTLPIIVAIDRHQDLVVAEMSEYLLRVGILLGEAKPQHIDR
jgi:hypothetical protein